MKGIIGSFIVGEQEKEISSFNTGPNSNWFKVPGTDTWNCKKTTAPFDGWIFNEEYCRWQSPTPYPNDGRVYQWDNSAQTWILVE